MIDLIDDCEMVVLSEENLISGFDCGNADLNGIFARHCESETRSNPVI